MVIKNFSLISHGSSMTYEAESVILKISSQRRLHFG